MNLYSLLLAVCASVASSAPVPGFRAPAVPLFLNSPFVNIWSAADNLYDVEPTLWDGSPIDFFSSIRVDGVSYLLMGSPTPSWSSNPLQTATQTSVTIFSTQTVYSFTAGAIALNMTFTSPLLPNDWELLSQPSHYVTYSVASTDGGSAHSVQVYFDASATIVAYDPSVLISWGRVPLGGGDVALSVGNVVQTPLQLTGNNGDHINWGTVYVSAASAPGGLSQALGYSNVTRSGFFASGVLPPADAPGSPAALYPAGSVMPGTGAQVGVDRSGQDLPGYPVVLKSADYNLCWAMCNKTAGCTAWAYGDPNCGGGSASPLCWLKSGYPATSNSKCRVSGQQPGEMGPGGEVMAAAVVYSFPPVGPTPISRYVVLSVDEYMQIDWFGEACPPYWRRDLPLNDTVTPPTAMLATSLNAYPAIIQSCNEFDATSGNLLEGVGGANYATMAQLTHRQVFGAMGLFFVPSKNTPWYMLKEISSCGCLDTADVVYPAFPQVLYYSPELMKLQIVPHLEYAMNYTNQPYPLAWAPHHLGHWPNADLPFTGQENMPLEETSWELLIIAAIGQRQGGDLTWLEPYWPAIQTWYEFLVTLLPFPGLQLSTDDFDGQLYNATNLAFKGVAAIAAYGYIVQQYTGNTTAAQEAYALAASYSEVMVQYAWLENATNPEQSHFMIGYAGSQGDGGEHTSWAMLYNILWLRLFGYDNLLPNQADYLSRMEAWYVANQMQEYGLPLNSRALFTKDDWMTFLAASYFDASSPPAPSSFSDALFDGLFNWANETQTRVPLSDWTYTNAPTVSGFKARPVYGAMYAPVLVAQGPQLGLGRKDDAAHLLARETFQRVHDASAAKKLETMA